MRIIITGGAGFIGSSLAGELISKGYEVSVLDNRVDFNSLKKIIDEISVHEIDVLNYKDLFEAISKCEGIIHLAAVSRVIWGFENPRKCLETNIQGTVNVLEAARKGTKKPIVFLTDQRESEYDYIITLGRNKVPETYKYLAEKYNAVIMIGDSELFDIGSAEQAGLRTFLVKDGDFTEVFEVLFGE